jgi:AraC family transcriptional regulator of adaptative response / DNA-3-methyladenine glycosylase II
VSVAGARTLAGRLTRGFGRAIAEPRGSLTHVFPSPSALADADVASIGMPAARGRAIRELAAAVARGELRLEPGSPPEEVKARLMAIPGIGRWTAEYVAMRALGEPDAFPSGDLGLRRAVGGLAPVALDGLAEAWRPWRAYATILLWRSE